MIPKLHATGTSFKGAAAYLLHDKDAATSGRVAWVETVNLLTANPEAAWRVMAATAMNAAQLKEQAGVKRTGNKSKKSVLHLTLAWSPDQKPERKDMSRFARRAIATLKADDLQAMIICHTDTDHPHVHILINRVSPADGRMLSSSNEKRALSDLARAYQKENGTAYCPQREINAEKRKNGEHVRAEKDLPRTEFEALREAQREVEKEIPAAVIKQNPQMAAEVRATMRSQARARLAAIKEQLRPQWRNLYERQRAETAKGQQEKNSVVERLRSWIGGKDKAASPAPGSGPGLAPSFQRQAFDGAAWDDKGREQKQRAERSSIVAKYSAEVQKAFGEIKTACQLAVRQMFVAHDRGGSILPEFRPAATGGAGQSPAPGLTPAQRSILERAEKFRSQDSTRKEAKPPDRQKDRDRDFEP